MASLLLGCAFVIRYRYVEIFNSYTGGLVSLLETMNPNIGCPKNAIGSTRFYRVLVRKVSYFSLILLPL